MAPKQLKTRKVPMGVINLSFSKSGTLSMKTALDKLGYNTYHGSVMMQRLQDNGPIKRMVDAKYYNKGKPFGRAEFDDLWCDFSALSDAPAIAFVEELVETYPEAKFILVERDVEEWYTSYEKQIIRSFENVLAYTAFYIIDPILRSGAATNMWKLHYALFNCTDQAGFRANARRTYLAHNELVKRVVPPEKLLRYKMGSGWEPLCEFLGKEVPSEAFPHMNEGEVFAVEQRKTQEREITRGLERMAKGVLPVLVPLLVGSAAWWVYRG